MARGDRIEVTLPGWAAAEAATERAFDGLEARMDHVVALARRNVREGSGGPFAAAVFARAGGRCVALGVNQVEASGQSLAHAEVLALGLAQRALAVRDLGAAPGELELVTSAEPCAMCLGAIVWSGIRRVVCGARRADVEAIGFDEGPEPEGGLAALERRGLEVVRDVGRDAARAVLRLYAERGGLVY